MKRTSFGEWSCSVARTVDLIGDWWTPLVLRDAFYGVRRFEDFQRDLGIGRNILTQRLTRLVDEGMLAKVPYQERPPRYEYRLTDKGRDFYPVLLAMLAWGDRWVSPDGPPVILHHETCDHDTHGVVVCAHCREALRPREVTARPGPGWGRADQGSGGADGEGRSSTTAFPPSTTSS